MATEKTKAAEQQQQHDGELTFNVEVGNLAEVEKRMAALQEAANEVAARLGQLPEPQPAYTEAHCRLVQDILKMSENTAPVEMSFGYTANGMCRHGLVVRKAPPSVISAIFDLPYNMCATIDQEGLHLELNASAYK